MNEAGNIAQVLGELPAGLHEVILVDGNSTDDTIEVARRRLSRRSASPPRRGKGKGDALRTGFAAATGNLIVMLDADGSADPAEIPRFVEALEAGADFAKGSRFLPGGGSADITRLRQLGNGFLSGTANMLHGTNFTDLCYGYNAFWRRCLPFISLDVPGFEVETLINLRIAGAGMKIAEVPSYREGRGSPAPATSTPSATGCASSARSPRGAPAAQRPQRAPGRRRGRDRAGPCRRAGRQALNPPTFRWPVPTSPSSSPPGASTRSPTSRPAWRRSAPRPCPRARSSSSPTTTPSWPPGRVSTWSG